MQKSARVAHFAADIQKQGTETIRNKATERPTGIPFVYSTDFAHNILMPKYREHDKFGNATHGNLKTYIYMYMFFCYIKTEKKNSHNGKYLF